MYSTFMVSCTDVKVHVTRVYYLCKCTGVLHLFLLIHGTLPSMSNITNVCAARRKKANHGLICKSSCLHFAHLYPCTDQIGIHCHIPCLALCIFHCILCCPEMILTTASNRTTPNVFYQCILEAEPFLVASFHQAFHLLLLINQSITP